MILSYTIPDGFGNHLSLIISARSREGCDHFAQQEIAKVQDFVFKLADATVSDITHQAVLRSSVFNHETGEED